MQLLRIKSYKPTKGIALSRKILPFKTLMQLRKIVEHIYIKSVTNFSHFFHSIFIITVEL